MLNSWIRTKHEVPCLVGRIVGHQYLDNHRLIQTSELFYVDGLGEFARTRSRWYRLGTHGAMSSGGLLKANLRRRSLVTDLTMLLALSALLHWNER